MTEWISLKDRYPEESQSVIAWVECDLCRKKIDHGHHLADYGYLPHSSKEMVWLGDRWNHINPNVTHWMPMPEGPK